MNIKIPSIDLFSFWAGFILASLFWFILLRFLKLLPRLKKSAAENRQKQESKKNVNRGHNIRLYTLRKSQSNHLASMLFPLDKILVEPFVLIPPDFITGMGEESSVSDINSILPYTPEVPELLADFPKEIVSLDTLIETYPFVCLSGEPGSGKTTALSALASRLAVDETKSLPVFLSCHIFQSDEGSAAEILWKHLSENISGLSAVSIEEIITQAATSSHLIFLIDALDELDKPDFDQVTTRIKELQITLPGAKFITTASTYYTGSLEDLGFYIFTLSAWNLNERKVLVRSWSNALQDILKSSNAENTQIQKSRLDKTTMWLLQENLETSPFELTLKIWFSLFNNIETPHPNKLVECYLKFVSDDCIPLEGYLAIIESIKQGENQPLTREKISEILSSRSEYFIREDLSPKVNSEETVLSLSGKSIEKRLSAKNIVDQLISYGLFSELPNGSLKFSHILISGYLKALVDAQAALLPLQSIIETPSEYSSLLYKPSSETDQGELINWLNQTDPPLYRNYLAGIHWLDQLAANNPLKLELFKRIARLLQDRAIPFGLRARFIKHLGKSQETSILSLLLILKDSRDSLVRQLAAFGLGLYTDEKAISGLTELSTDENTSVQNFAIVSLGRIWTPSSQDALANAIFTADESVRAKACVVLSLHKPDGHEMLREIMTTDNYLARKAAISGLRKINEPWVRELLEKVSVSDTQWIVRDSAINTLDHLAENPASILEKWLPVLENPWTLEKAEEFGMELPAQLFPGDLLFTVFEKGHDRDKRIALHYLLSQPTPRLIELLNQISRQEGADIREEAINALFNLSRRGLNVQ